MGSCNFYYYNYESQYEYSFPCYKETINNYNNNIYNFINNSSNSDIGRKELLRKYSNNLNDFSENNNESDNKNNENNITERIKVSNTGGINISFIFNGKKELYLTVSISHTFEQVQKLLTEKYNWITNFSNVSYYYNDKLINDYTKTINELGINNNVTIKIEAN